MEKAINRVELKGNVGFDPKVTLLDDGNLVMRLSMATNESFKSKSGEWKEETTWHNVVAWGGKSMPDFSKVRKGSLVHVVGRIKPVQYQTKAGQDRYSYEIVAQTLEDLTPVD